MQSTAVPNGTAVFLETPLTSDNGHDEGTSNFKTRFPAWPTQKFDRGKSLVNELSCSVQISYTVDALIFRRFAYN